MTDMNHRAPADKVCGYEYTVKRGDSFYLIAHRLGVPLRDLLEANAEVNPARLMVGDVLCIPMEEDDAPQITPEPVPLPEEPDEPDDVPEDMDRPAQEAPCGNARQYVVQPGETVADIQLQAGLNRHTLQQANPDSDLDEVAPGDVLCVPLVNQPCPVPRSYTLTAEDTLETVALKQNVSVAALLRANPCLAPGDFVAGVAVNLP
ncbi:MAG: LysM peptidoglycan-binding domain-containing protein [Clostridia bacterium]|nr:LysM peptidoglycan-binding domain-containing protein [Clostridia bacterium]